MRSGMSILALAFLTPAASAQLYTDPFTHPSGWTFTSSLPWIHWAVDASPSSLHTIEVCTGGPPSWTSPPYSLNYNDGFEIGGPAWGHATSPPIDLTGSVNPVLRFQSAWCHEGWCFYDVRTLTILDADSQPLLVRCVDELQPTPNVWEELVFALQPDWGEIRVRFSFENTDGILNYGPGWFIDDLAIDDDAYPMPERYCPTSPNSADPSGAQILLTGSIRLSADQVALSAFTCPPNQWALFIFGRTATQVPFGDGWRCVGGQLGRFPAVNTGPAGLALHTVDLASPPGNQITPGSQWNFQCWFRDPAAGGAGFNSSDALAIDFIP